MKKKIWKLGLLALFCLCLLGIVQGNQAEAARRVRKVTVKAPFGFKVKDYDRNYVRLTWKRPAKSTGVFVYIYDTKTRRYKRVARSRGNSVTLQGLEEGKRYVFAARTYYKKGGKTYYSKYTKKVAVRLKKIPTKRATTLKKFLTNAIKPLGKTLYVWGGGWGDLGGSKEARTIGVSSSWARLFKQSDASYSYQSTLYQSSKGLDCSGYVGWCLYNALYTKSGNNGFVRKAETMAKYYAGLGWGDYIPKRSVKDYKPGDILSSNCSDCGHVWISLGTCEDGSVVVLHSTSNGGVQLSGTVSDEGEYDSYASRMAKFYMERFYPEWAKRYPDGYDRPANYRSHYCQLRWDVSGSSVMTDPDGWQDLSAEEVLTRLFGVKPEIEKYNAEEESEAPETEEETEWNIVVG